MDVLRRGSDAVRWYVGAMMGDSDYQRYLTHHRAHHPADAPMTERDYWRTRYRDQDRNPQGRCC
ncbi:YbdD/YjiX family protein [Williamsia muralis]|uniref:YbdD/YjiX family protein n=1 Tax=Williamsia marianensis TaxID=85044 RepID=UPI003F172EA3